MNENEAIKFSKNKKNIHAALDIGNSKIACMIAQEVESNNVQIKVPCCASLTADNLFNRWAACRG